MFNSYERLLIHFLSYSYYDLYYNKTNLLVIYIAKATNVHTLH